MCCYDGKERVNKTVLRYFRTTGRDADDVTESERLFHARAAATEKARLHRTQVVSRSLRPAAAPIYSYIPLDEMTYWSISHLVWRQLYIGHHLYLSRMRTTKNGKISCFLSKIIGILVSKRDHQQSERLNALLATFKFHLNCVTVSDARYGEIK